MPSIAQIISLISADVTPKLASVGINLTLPQTGKSPGFLVGSRYLQSNIAPNAIIVVIKGSKFGPKSVFSSSLAASGTYSAEQLIQLRNQTVASDYTTLEFHCIGEAQPADPDGGDFDVARAMYQQIIASLDLLNRGNYTLTTGEWTDQKPNAAQSVTRGHEFVFQVTIGTPVINIVLPLVPADTGFTATVNLDVGDEA